MDEADWDPFGDPADAAPEQAAAAPPAAAAQATVVVAEHADGEDDSFVDSIFGDPAKAAGTPLPCLPQKKPEPTRPLDVPGLVRRLGAFAERVEAGGEGDAVLDEIVADARAAGAERHMAMCVMASRAVSVLGALREGEAPHGKPLLHGLLAGIRRISASETDEVMSVEPEGAFSGNVVFLFGWGGSSPHDMLDCVQRYRALDPGCHVVALTLAGPTSGPAQAANALQAAARSWAGAPEGCRPSLLVHLFSNNGFLAWTTMLQLWEEQVEARDRRRLRAPLPPMASVLRGVLLDSSPDGLLPTSYGLQSAVQSQIAMLASLTAFDSDGKARDERGMMAASWLAKCESLSNNAAAIREFCREQQSEEELHAMTRAPGGPVHEREPPVPLFFLYSANDAIIPAEGVERYMAECNARPSRVAAGMPEPGTLKFARSDHCMHKLQFADEYWQAVCGFVMDAFRS